jgi:hypothetical protein
VPPGAAARAGPTYAQLPHHPPSLPISLLAWLLRHRLVSLSAFGLEDAADRHFPFRSAQAGLAARDSAELRVALRRAVQAP